MNDPRFNDPEVDLDDDEYGGPGDFDTAGSLGEGTYGEDDE